MAFLWAPPVPPTPGCPGYESCNSPSFSSPQQKKKGGKHACVNHLHEQVNFLVQAAVASSLLSPALSRTLFRDARQISLKHSLRLSSDLKWAACKNCHTLYLPGISSHIHTESFPSCDGSKARKKRRKRLGEKQDRDVQIKHKLSGDTYKDECEEETSQETELFHSNIPGAAEAVPDQTDERGIKTTTAQEIRRDSSFPGEAWAVDSGAVEPSMTLDSPDCLERPRRRRRTRRGQQCKRIEKRAAKERRSSQLQEDTHKRQSDCIYASLLPVSDDTSPESTRKTESCRPFLKDGGSEGQSTHGDLPSSSGRPRTCPLQGENEMTHHTGSTESDSPDSGRRSSGLKRPLPCRAETKDFVVVTCLVCGTTRRRGCNEKLELQNEDAVR
ncbi:rnase p protein subunit domain containing protein [Cystoisospora suis]|uniref:Rnase p protein subunit domain containing protein n=1 Tax=Cystoisospora suis TaxID=483139 RepID=A0A2C6KJ18_9APIC|nr:rnase p protein subunit domain containing protein [Cystoisospora suis]